MSHYHTKPRKFIMDDEKAIMKSHELIATPLVVVFMSFSGAFANLRRGVRSTAMCVRPSVRHNGPSWFSPDGFS
jgi:hypothetical protein